MRKPDTHQGPEMALNEIKDHAVLLTMATKYLCDTPILKRLGFHLQEETEALRKEIGNLKRKFIGKPTEEIDVEGPLEGVSRLAKQLQKADKTVNEQCLVGDLGRELTEKTKALFGGMAALRERLEGRPVSMGKAEPILIALRPLKMVARVIAIFSRYTLRITILFLFLCSILFTYLFITMEKEEDLLRQIDHYRTEIESKQLAISQIQKQMSEIQEKAGVFTQQELSRQEKVEVIDLSVKKLRLAEEREKIELEIRLKKKALEECSKRVEEIGRKSLLERLLRL